MQSETTRHLLLLITNKKKRSTRSTNIDCSPSNRVPLSPQHQLRFRFQYNHSQNHCLSNNHQLPNQSSRTRKTSQRKRQRAKSRRRRSRSQKPAKASVCLELMVRVLSYKPNNLFTTKSNDAPSTVV